MKTNYYVQNHILNPKPGMYSGAGIYSGVVSVSSANFRVSFLKVDCTMLKSDGCFFGGIAEMSFMELHASLGDKDK